MKQSLVFILSIILLLSVTSINAQKKNYCDWTGCRLAPEHKAHFNPYYNGHLCENFNPKQIDYSQEYLNLQTKNISEISTEITSKINNYNFALDSLFNTTNSQQNGIIGKNYKRIKVHISKTERNTKNNLAFTVYGKSNVRGNICSFKGKIEIRNIFEIEENYDFKGQGVLFANYELFEDKNQSHVGYFKGVFECSIKINHENKSIKLDESFNIADGYYNRTYVGTWTSYKTKLPKKCIWGDYRLPFTFDFDCGDGEMKVSSKYEKNGWKGFNSSNEYEFVNGTYQLKSKWWK